MKTKNDVINALIEANFLERASDLKKQFNNRPVGNGFRARKDKVIKTVNELGYSSYMKQDWYFIDDVDDYGKQKVFFKFDDYWIEICYRFYDGDSEIFSNSISGLQAIVSGNKDYYSGCPIVNSYEDLHEILETVMSIYNDSVMILSGDLTLADYKNHNLHELMCVKTSKRDVLEVLKRVHFYERTTEISNAFNKLSKTPLPEVDKKKIFEIIQYFGYEPGYEHSCFYLKNQIVGPFKFDMRFCLKWFLGDFQWHVYEEGVRIYGTVWMGINEDLVGDGVQVPCRPSFRNLGELKELLAVAFEMFEDFKQTLCESKGIEYTRITGEAE